MFLNVVTFTRAEICQFDYIAGYEDILRLNVPMENSLFMHVFDRLQNLIGDVAHPCLIDLFPFRLQILV